MYSRTQQEANEEENKCVVYFRLKKSTFTLTDPVNAATNLPAAKVLLGLMVVPPPPQKPAEISPQAAPTSTGNANT